MTELEIGFWTACVLQIVFGALWVRAKLSKQKLEQELQFMKNQPTPVIYKALEPIKLRHQFRLRPLMEIASPEANKVFYERQIEQAKREFLQEVGNFVEIIKFRENSMRAFEPDTEEIELRLMIYKSPQ